MDAKRSPLTTHQASQLTNTDLSLEALQNQLLQQLMNNRKRELFKANTFLGPHRDDLLFIVNGQNVQTYGSQGQTANDSFKY